MISALLISVVLSQNYQGYPVAPRSTGMGGAATALGRGAGNTYYNPATIAFGDAALIGDVSGNVLAGSLTRLSSQFGQTSNTPTFGFQLIPSNYSFEWRGLDLGPIHLSDRWGLGVSVLAPFDVVLGTNVSTADSQALINSTERVYAIYNSVAYRFSDEIGIGLSVVAMYRQFDGTVFLDHFTDGKIVTATLKESRKSISHGLAFGMQWKPLNGFRAGLSIQLPITSVFGWGDNNGRITVTDADGKLVHQSLDQKVESRYELPWRFNLGLAYEVTKKWAIAADLSVHTPLQYVSERDLTTGATLNMMRLLPVVNVNVGAEFYVGGRGLRTGFFTDHSPNAITGSLDAQSINRYGWTASMDIERKLYRTEIGVLFSVGFIKANTPDLVSGSLDPIAVNGTEFRGMITYSSTLKFF